ncbi:MAG: polymer-forming cytoskeletal protein [Candidatus Hodarchaeales archaeon]
MSNKEIDELKTLIKSLDIRLKNDEISKAEYEELKEKYEKRLEEEIRLIKEKSFLQDLSYISISGSGKVTDSYIKISGSGLVEGWHGGSIKISGSGLITDDEIKISGSGVIPGDLKTTRLSVSGAFKSEGSLEATTVNISGSCKIEGSLTVYERVAVSGSIKIGGDLIANEAELVSGGSLKVEGLVTCFTAELNGKYNIGGDLSCQDSFTSYLTSKSRINGDIKCGGDVYIEQEKRGGILKVPRIIAQGDVYVEGVETEYISGRTVKIGPKCKIGDVEEKLEN